MKGLTNPGFDSSVTIVERTYGFQDVTSWSAECWPQEGSFENWAITMLQGCIDLLELVRDPAWDYSYA